MRLSMTAFHGFVYFFGYEIVLLVAKVRIFHLKMKKDVPGTLQIKQASANLLKVFEKFDFGSRVI